MFSRQPSFFRLDASLYATYPGSPARGLLTEPAGYWLAWCPDIKSQDRAMAFQVYCHALSNCTQSLSAMGILDGQSMRFSCAVKRKHDLRSFLVNAWYTHYQFGWMWHDETIAVPENAKWLPHPGANLMA